MSCNDSDVVVERHVELPASPDVVWEALPELFGDDVDLPVEPGGVVHADEPDGERIGVIVESVPGERLTFRWATTDGDEPPSEVGITLERSESGTILHIRETRLDGSHLARSAFLAHARA